MALLRYGLQPTDFADADCRVSAWREGDFHGYSAVRVWACRVSGGYWFHRHEWAQPGKNSTALDDWSFYGYFPRKQWEAHMQPAPDLDA